MGARAYSPGLDRFLSLDLYNGALSDVRLGSSPFTANRYAFAAGNPLSMIDLTGHWPSWSDVGHATLDVVGLVPVVGEPADLANGAWYAASGDYVNAGLSFASAVPVAGYGASAVKAGKYARKGYKAVKEGEKAAEATAAGVKTTRNLAEEAAEAGGRSGTPSAVSGGKSSAGGGGSAGKIPGPTKAPTQPPSPAPAKARGGETYYRAMSPEHAAELSRTGRLPATGETFVSPTREFAEGYEGVLMQFTVRPGTTDALSNIGVRDSSVATRSRFPGMPTVRKGWAATSALFKAEGNQINIGLGQGPGLRIFNDAITDFVRLR